MILPISLKLAKILLCISNKPCNTNFFVIVFKYKIAKGGINIKKYLIYSFIFLVISLIFFYYPIEIATNDNPTIFVIDTKVDKSFLETPIARIKVNSLHGNKVVATIRNLTSTTIIPISAENFLGDIDKDKYILALKEVEKFSKNNPQKDILVNISLGFTEKEFQEELIKKISGEDLHIIAAAGNNNSEKKIYPAAFTEVLAVAGLEKNKKMVESNYGEYVDISASGVMKINENFYLPSLNFSQTSIIKGTSFAAPQVTALLAKMKSYNKNLTINQAIEIMKESATEIEDKLYKENKLGSGKTNKLKSLNKVSPVYFWGRMLTLTSLSIFLLILFVILWKKISLAAILVFLFLLVISVFMMPFLIILYRYLGFVKILVAIFFIMAFYYINKKVILYYLQKGKKIKFILFLSYFLNERMKKLAIKRISFLLINDKDVSDKILKEKLNNTFSPAKAKLYLRIFCRLKKPPMFLCIKKTEYYNLKGDFIGNKLSKIDRTNKEKAIIVGELLYHLFYSKYKEQKITAEIIKSYSSPMILVPIKNILKKRNKIISDREVVIFILEIIESFHIQAKDFSIFVRKIIEQSDDSWLKYYAVKAYLKIGREDVDYRAYIDNIKIKEKEPVILALKD